MVSHLSLSTPEAESSAEGLPTSALDPPARDMVVLTPSAPSAPPSDVASSGRKRARRGRSPRGIGIALLPALVVLLVWQALVSAQVMPTLLLPAPGDVLRTFWQDFIVNALGGQTLVPYVVATLVESLVGFALGTLVAMPLGYGIARSRWFARASQPYVAASQALPAAALAPLLALWLGFGLAPIVALCALIIFFPMVVNTVAGLRAVDREVVEAARVDGAGRWQLLRAIEVPLALPTILAGMRTSLTLSITGAVVGEFVIGDRGLGGLLSIARGNNDAALEFATLLMLALLAAALYGVARLSERRFSYLEAE